LEKKYDDQNQLDRQGAVQTGLRRPAQTENGVHSTIGGFLFHWKKNMTTKIN
jgi:hypothetical protein